MDYEDIRYKVLCNDEVVTIKRYNQNFVAKTDKREIEVGNLFFEFSPLERECIIYHEQSHQREKSPQRFFAYLSRHYKHKLEFDADFYAMQKTSATDLIKALERLRILIEVGILSKSHEKTHLPIEDRIKRIKENNI